MSKSRARAIEFVKWIFAGSILFVLIRSGKLSLTDVQSFLKDPTAGLSCVVLVGLMLSLAFLRWHTLLKSQRIELPYVKVFQLGMLGQFFSTVIPGTVGGDLVKAVYIARRFPQHKVKTVSTILMDRVIGLSGMIVMAGVSFLLGRTHLHEVSNPSVKYVEWMGWVLVTLAGVILAGLALLPRLGALFPEDFSRSVFARLPGSGKLVSAYAAARAYQCETLALWKALGLSLVMQTFNVTALFLVARAIFGAYPWGQIDAPLFILGSLLGMAAQAVPIAPMGLGVGQVAFAAIFQILGAPSESFGASIVTGLQVVTLAMNLTGALFFATYKHEAQAAAGEAI